MKNGMLYGALVIIVLLVLNTCRLNRDISGKNIQITSELLAKQKLDSMLSVKNQVIYKQEVLITSNQQSINELTDSIFALRRRDEKNLKTIAYYKANSKTILKDVLVPYLDSIKMREFSDSVRLYCQELIDYVQDSSVLVGTTASDSTANYSISQTIEKDGIRINSLSIPDTLQLRFVEKRGNIFRSPKIEVQYFHTNPLIRTTSSNSVFYKPKKKSNLLPKALLVAAGIFVGTKL